MFQKPEEVLLEEEESELPEEGGSRGSGVGQGTQPGKYWSVPGAALPRAGGQQGAGVSEGRATFRGTKRG